MIDPEEITHDAALDVFRAAFMRRVGVGKMSYSDLHEATGLRVRTLKSWRDGQSMPQLDSWLRLCRVFGPAFTSECLHLIGQGGVDAIEPTRSDAPGCCADLARQLGEITDRLRDGVFDHADKAAVGPQLIALARELERQGRAMQAEHPRHNTVRVAS